MADPSCLLVVADYPFVAVHDDIFASIPWDEAFARPYQARFSRILLLGRTRRAAAPPPGWFRVDPRFFEVIDAGHWDGVSQFLRNLPRLWRSLGANWSRIRVLYLKLFYLTSLAVWWYNRVPGRRRLPVATLLVGDSAAAFSLRDDMVRRAGVRSLLAGLVTRIVRGIQSRADLPGFVASFLAKQYGSGRPQELVVSESWLHESMVREHGRTAPRQPAILFLAARLVPLKRANLLLDAVATLVREGRDVRCVIAGDGPERAALVEQAGRLGLTNRVAFPGWLAVMGPDMLRLYDGADLFCLPSFSEGLPLVVIEAMARGVPVVATAVSGTPELVVPGESGLLVPRDDLDALVMGLRQLLDDPALWRRCVAGGYRVARQHTFERQRGRLAEAIGGLAR